MKTVIIPHPTELLVLIREQKRIIRAINTVAAEERSDTSGCLLFPQYPLWCKIDSNGQQPAELRTAISLFQINAPEIRESGIIFPCQCIIDQKTLYSYIPAAVYNKKVPRQKIEQILSVAADIAGTAKIYPLLCRIFRIGTAVTENHAWKIMDEVWVKTTVDS